MPAMPILHIIRKIRLPLIATLLALSLCACSSPPKPPTVDESTRRPANSALAVELQVCKSDLQNTRILASESARATESAQATAASLAAQQAITATVTAVHGATAAEPNSVYSILFAFGSARVHVNDDDATRLINEARAAPLILLRGRTDGTVESAGESRLARERSAAVRTYLVQAGIDPARVRATWQPVGDPAADNTSAAGRTLNRRVEIEIYRAAPQQFALSSVPP